MAVAEYPMVSTNPANPAPNLFYALIETFNVDFTEYDDSGRDYKLQNGGTGVRRWILEYQGMDTTKTAILDSHVASAKLGPEGSAHSFSFRDRDTAVLYANVRYETYERIPHVRTWIQSRKVVLVKYP